MKTRICHHLYSVMIVKCHSEVQDKHKERSEPEKKKVALEMWGHAWVCQRVDSRQKCECLWRTLLKDVCMSCQVRVMWEDVLVSIKSGVSGKVGPYLVQ